MRYEYLVAHPCQKCDCPLTSLACYCCSEVSDHFCKKCGHKEQISSKQAWEWMHLKVHRRNGAFTGKRFDGSSWTSWYRYVHRPENIGHPKSPSDLKEEWEMKGLTLEEATPYEELARQHGVLGVKGPQIGFVGNKQVFDPPWQL